MRVMLFCGGTVEQSSFNGTGCMHGITKLGEGKNGLKRTVSRDFLPRFHKLYSPKPLKITLESFRILLKICEDTLSQK
jgi:hypothetical protein